MKGASYLLPSVLKTLIFPPLLAHILLRQLRPPLLVQLICYWLSLPVLYILRTELSVYRTQNLARRAGARPPLNVKGRYPLNIDVLLDWAKSGSEEEVGRMMVLLGRQYGGTYNTRVLGEDQVSFRSRDCLSNERRS